MISTGSPPTSMILLFCIRYKIVNYIKNCAGTDGLITG